MVLEISFDCQGFSTFASERQFTEKKNCLEAFHDNKIEVKEYKS